MDVDTTEYPPFEEYGELFNYTTVELEEPENIAAKVMGVINSLIALAVIILNILILVVIICNKSLQNSTYVIVANLVVCNLIYGFMLMPSFVVSSVLEDWVFGNILCKIVMQSSQMMPLGSSSTRSTACRTIKERIKVMVDLNSDHSNVKPLGS